VWRALGALSPSDFAWSAMVNPPSIRLINSIKMDLSSASNAANNGVDDGGITGVNSAIDSLPHIRQNQRLKCQLSQLTHGDDGDPDNELFRSYQESTAAHCLVHSPDRVHRRLQAILDGREEEQSQFLFTQLPDGLPLTPNQHRLSHALR
jgi:alkanesulfonate monooxygenase SsuD/methylene tetrahydromethanopterin reductase-like flavin-dependent oxidoreductase (luciferase family)